MEGKKKAKVTTDFLLLLYAGNKTRGSFIPENNDITTTSTYISRTSLQEMQLRNRCYENHTIMHSRQNKLKALLGEEVPGSDTFCVIETGLLLCFVLLQYILSGFMGREQ